MKALLAWCALCGIVSSVWCVTSAAALGATFDEPTYVAAGLDRWRDGRIGGLMRLGTMPLPVDVATLPIRIAEWARREPFAIATDGRGRVTVGRDIPQVLPLARAMTLVFWWILLAAGGLLAYRLSGRPGAALAVAFLAAEPSLLAHATLATTDIAVTAFLLAFAAALARERQRLDSPGSRARQPRVGPGPRPRNEWWIPGVWFGLALLSKASALVFAPLIAVAALASQRRPWRECARDISKMTLLALAMAFIYCGPGAGEAIFRQVTHNIRGHDTYLLGHPYARAVWFYFPVVLLIKASGAVLVGAAALTMFRRGSLGNWVFAAVALLLVCSPVYRVQTGCAWFCRFWPLRSWRSRWPRHAQWQLRQLRHVRGAPDLPSWYC